MNREKVLELARESELVRQLALEVPFVVDRLERFAALIEREVRWVRGSAEPVAFQFQHEDTGLIDFVDPQQVEWGFQKNNPRWQLIGPVFRHPAPAVDAEPVGYTNEGYKGMQYANAEAYNQIRPDFIERNKLTAPLYKHPAPAVVRQLVEALKAAGLFAHHCWCDVAMNEYSSKKLDETMTEIDAALAAAKEAGL